MNVIQPKGNNAPAKIVEAANAPVANASGNPMVLLERAVSAGANIETLEKLMGLQERWEANQARKAFDNAMAAVRADLPAIIKTKEVSFGNGRAAYRYEELSAVTEALSPIMAQHGLSFRWRTDTAEKGVVKVTCIIAHRDGHFEETALSAGHDSSGNKNAIQALGSAVTYLQRYTLKAAIGIAAAADDDARAVSQGTDSNEPITEAQRDDLMVRIEAAGADITAFCGYFKVGAISELRQSQLPRALAALEQKKRQAAS